MMTFIYENIFVSFENLFFHHIVTFPTQILNPLQVILLIFAQLYIVMIQLKQNTMTSDANNGHNALTDCKNYFEDCSNCQFGTKQSSGTSPSITQISLERKFSNRSFLSIVEQPLSKNFKSKLSNTNSLSEKFFELDIVQATHIYDDEAERKQEDQQNKTQSQIFSQADSFTVENEMPDDDDDDFMSENSDQNLISLNYGRSINEELNELIKNRKIQLLNPSKIGNSHSTAFDEDQILSEKNCLISELPKIEMENFIEQRFTEFQGPLDLIVQQESQGFGKSSMESRSRSSELMSSLGTNKHSGANLASSLSENKQNCKLNREISSIEMDLPEDFLLMESLKLSYKLSKAERKKQDKYQKQSITNRSENQNQLSTKNLLVLEKAVSAGPTLKETNKQFEQYLLKQSSKLQFQNKNKLDLIRSIKEPVMNITVDSLSTSLLGSITASYTSEALISNSNNLQKKIESNQQGSLFISLSDSMNMN